MNDISYITNIYFSKFTYIYQVFFCVLEVEKFEVLDKFFKQYATIETIEDMTLYDKWEYGLKVTKMTQILRIYDIYREYLIDVQKRNA